MKLAWISGRFLLAGMALILILGSMGYSHPVSSLKEILGLQETSEFVKISAPLNSSASTDEEMESHEPVGKAEDLVKDWEKPKFVLFITGRQHGYIEPCGCITLARQKGGLMRRHTAQKILEGRGWDVVPIDAGNQVRRVGQQPVIKLRKTYDALCKEMDYSVIGLGPDDLKLSAIEIGQTMANVVDGDKNPFTCANVEVFDEAFTNRFVVIQRNGKRIGVTMVLGDEHLDGIKQDSVTTESAAEGLATVVDELNQANCDMKVLIAFTDLDNCRELAKQFPVFDVLITAGGAGDPTFQPELIEAGDHTTSMVQVGVKGMYVGLIGYYETEGQSPRIEYERVALDHRYKDSEDIKGIFKSYQDTLKSLWENELLEDIEPRDHPSGNRFVGSESCAGCHEEEFDIWENGIDGYGGPHEKATRDLEQNPNDDRVWVQRHFDPECISCHATGWNPQNFYPYKTGFMKLADVHLHANGCENCHGPGSAHVEIEERAGKGERVDQALRKELAEQLDVTIAESRANACKECHDLDNSPDFLKEGGFDEYWPKIEHGDGDDE